MGERKKIRLFGIDSEPNVYDCEVEMKGDSFQLKSMKKIGVWRTEPDDKKKQGG